MYVVVSNLNMFLVLLLLSFLIFSRRVVIFIVKKLCFFFSVQTLVVNLSLTQNSKNIMIFLINIILRFNVNIYALIVRSRYVGT